MSNETSRHRAEHAQCAKVGLLCRLAARYLHAQLLVLTTSIGPACAVMKPIEVPDKRTPIDAQVYQDRPDLKRMRADLYEAATGDDVPTRNHKLEAAWAKWQKLDREVVPLAPVHRLHVACVLACLGLLTGNDSAAATLGLQCPPTADFSSFALYLREAAERIHSARKEDTSVVPVTVSIAGVQLAGKIRLVLDPIGPGSDGRSPFEMVLAIPAPPGRLVAYLAPGRWSLTLLAPDGQPLPGTVDASAATFAVQMPPSVSNQAQVTVVHRRAQRTKKGGSR
jgi:hypothetical protein